MAVGGVHENGERVASVIGLQGLNHDYQRTSADPLDRSFKARAYPRGAKEVDLVSQSSHPYLETEVRNSAVHFGQVQHDLNFYRDS